MNEKNDNILKDLKQHSFVLLHELASLMEKIAGYRNQFMHYQSIDLRRTTLDKYSNLFQSFFIGTVTCCHDHTLNRLASVTINNISEQIQGCNTSSLVGHFLFCYRNVLSEIIEQFENLLFQIWRIKTKMEDNYKKFEFLLSYFEEKLILSSEQKAFLSSWANNFRNPRHHSFFRYTHSKTCST